MSMSPIEIGDEVLVYGGTNFNDELDDIIRVIGKVKSVAPHPHYPGMFLYGVEGDNTTTSFVVAKKHKDLYNKKIDEIIANNKRKIRWNQQEIERLQEDNIEIEKRLYVASSARLSGGRRKTLRRKY